MNQRNKETKNQEARKEGRKEGRDLEKDAWIPHFAGTTQLCLVPPDGVPQPCTHLHPLFLVNRCIVLLQTLLLQKQEAGGWKFKRVEVFFPETSDQTSA